jgi:putative transposase
VKNWNSALEHRGEKVLPIAMAIAMGPLPAILSPPPGVLKISRFEDDREGAFHTQVFERYSRYEPEVAEALTEMFVSGTSTHKVGKVTETLTGVAPSASAVSRLNQTLTEQFETWRERPLLTHSRILYLDGIHFTVRHGTKTDSTIILTALAVDMEGNKDVLALRACAEEDKAGWRCLLQDLRRRGATEIDLIVTDGHEGLLAAVSSLFTATLRQRCLIHKQRNVLNAIAHRERQEVATELQGIWRQDQIDAFTTETSCLTIVWATMQDIHLPRIPVS